MKFSERRMKEALELLLVIKQDSSQVGLLLKLQKQLIRQLKVIEKHIIYLKKARSRLQNRKKQKRHPTEAANVKALKSLISMCDIRVKEYHHQRFLWRCIGDGIAAIYQSKHSLKQLYFDQNHKPKQESGFISGKIGFKNEYKMLVKGIRMGVPVILSDLTNIIRYGDLCALAGEEPLIIEMKTSKNRNARTERQVQQLSELSRFFSNDEIYNYRGSPLTIRKAMISEEINYESIVNHCIEKAIETNDFLAVTPERGLKYFVFTDEWFKNKQKDLDYYLSEPKKHLMIVHITCDERFLPSYPFVLSMNPENALFFMQNKISIIVEIDLMVVKGKFNNQELHVIALFDGSSAFQVMFDKNDIYKGVFRISEMLFLRVATEFLSLDWFVEEQTKISGDFNLSGSDVAFDEDSLLLLESWKDIKDFFEY
ncbi:hypothetical protein [Shewanella algae]|uniref:hypothetical protein n=1 Tax=Shewanella algae TaxID=38313 RepID=UPI0031F4BACF